MQNKFGSNAKGQRDPNSNEENQQLRVANESQRISKQYLFASMRSISPDNQMIVQKMLDILTIINQKGLYTCEKSSPQLILMVTELNKQAKKLQTDFNCQPNNTNYLKIVQLLQKFEAIIQLYRIELQVKDISAQIEKERLQINKGLDLITDIYQNIESFEGTNFNINQIKLNNSRKKRDYQNAIKYLQLADIQQQNQNSKCQTMGDIYYQWKNYDLALQLYVKAWKDNKQCDKLNFKIGQVYFLKNQFYKAQKYLAKIKKQDISGNRFYYLAVIAKKYQKYQEANSYYLQAIQAIKKMELWEDKNLYCKQLIVDFTKLLKVKKNKEMSGIYLQLAQLLQKMQKFEQQIKAYQMCITLEQKQNKIQQYTFKVGKLNRFIGNYCRSIESFKKIQQKQISYEGLHYQFGMAYKQINEKKFAIQQFKLALNDKPDDYQSIQELGKVYESQGQYELAIKQFLKIIIFNPTSEIILRMLDVTVKAKNYSNNITKFTQMLDCSYQNIKKQLKLQIEASRFDLNRSQIGQICQNDNFKKIKHLVGKANFHWIDKQQRHECSAQGSGFLIAEDLFITARHNLFLSGKIQMCQNCTVQFVETQNYEDVIYFQSQSSNQWYYSDKIDIAIIKLKNKVPFFKNDIIKLCANKDLKMMYQHRNIYVAGFSGQFRTHQEQKDKMRIIAGSFMNFNNSEIHYKAEAKKGMSGSPIICQIKKGQMIILGIHTNKKKQNNHCKGVLFNQNQINQINHWIDCYKAVKYKQEKQFGKMKQKILQQLELFQTNFISEKDSYNTKELFAEYYQNKIINDPCNKNVYFEINNKLKFNGISLKQFYKGVIAKCPRAILAYQQLQNLQINTNELEQFYQQIKKKDIYNPYISLYLNHNPAVSLQKNQYLLTSNESKLQQQLKKLNKFTQDIQNYTSQLKTKIQQVDNLFKLTDYKQYQSQFENSKLLDFLNEHQNEQIEHSIKSKSNFTDGISIQLKESQR